MSTSPALATAAHRRCRCQPRRCHHVAISLAPPRGTAADNATVTADGVVVVVIGYAMHRQCRLPPLYTVATTGTDHSPPFLFSPHLGEAPRAPGRAVLVCAALLHRRNIDYIQFASNPAAVVIAAVLPSSSEQCFAAVGATRAEAPCLF